MNTVELKGQRTKVKADRKKMAGLVIERDLTPEEQGQFDAMSAVIDALDKRIAVLESVEDKEAEVETDEEEAAKLEDKVVENSRKPLVFNMSTSKTRKDSGKYSIQRALQQSILTGQVSTGIEGEKNQEVARSRGPAQGFYLPSDAPVSAKHRSIQRDLTTSTGSGGVGILTEPTFIDLLRSRMVLERLGVQVRSGLQGKVNIPRQNQATQFNWIGEGVNATPSNPSFDAVSLVPHTASTLVNISRKMIFEASFDAQQAVENDMSQVMARGIDTAGLNGNPSVQAASPLGILQNPACYNYVLGADGGNGGKISYGDILGIESYVASQNMNSEQLGWVMTPGLRGYLKAAPKVTGATPYPIFIYENDGIHGVVNGYPVEVTTEMPSNLTKGTANTCHSAIFGAWDDCILALWGGTDVCINPYIYASSGAVQIVMLQEVDFQVQHPSAFIAVSDALLV